MHCAVYLPRLRVRGIIEMDVDFPVILAESTPIIPRLHKQCAGEGQGFQGYAVYADYMYIPCGTFPACTRYLCKILVMLAGIPLMH